METGWILKLQLPFPDRSGLFRRRSAKTPPQYCGEHEPSGWYLIPIYKQARSVLVPAGLAIPDAKQSEKVKTATFVPTIPY